MSPINPLKKISTQTLTTKPSEWICAISQMTSTYEHEQNFEVARDHLYKAQQQGARLIAFPENFLYFGDEDHPPFDFANRFASRYLKELCELSKKLSLNILAGSVAWPVPGKKDKIFNRSTFISDKGKILSHYDKIHLFDVKVGGDRDYLESKRVKRGTKSVIVKSLGQAIGLAICYDVRFPELFRSYSSKGATILTLPSAFTAPTGAAHWDVLTRSRAIENLSFLIAPAQWGTHSKNPHGARQTYGHSRVVSPWGEVLCEIKEGVGVAFARLDFARLKELRENFPALSHRRLD